MHSKVKICGLKRPEDVEAAILYGASYLGFIVEAKSSRRVSVADAAVLSRPANGSAKTVAVTVNPDDALIMAIAAHMQPDYIQLHGDESVDRVAEIARLSKTRIIKAVAIATAEDMKQAEHYAGVADFLLYDAKPPTRPDGVETARGGHGLSFDWNILAAAPLPKIWALAGGLTPDNAAEALQRTNAPILDVSSGLEASAGVKDAAKIQAFMKAVHDQG
ncbi:phosphoribosylanthranilate isomerase [Hellea balneolensis]|uniref:phosphoribosylanthranilate isomerase n=1 Tax=Hellea balneolensis TaxID=287478 RepID=UPI00047D873F|nr:phosphoribosylanthranilate isomerase [Hellea balneolensis]